MVLTDLDLKSDATCNFNGDGKMVVLQWRRQSDESLSEVGYFNGDEKRPIHTKYSATDFFRRIDEQKEKMSLARVKVPPNSATLAEARHRTFDFFRAACRSIPAIMDIYNLYDVVNPSQLRSTIASEIRKNAHITNPKVNLFRSR
ncbi:hypothetical protein E3N88_42787 [Mikania micrantha]|uniref:Uncharacterized protein n=1 Tax=Mikania micrantha TaxID=192012 RepID=A0A5N6LGV4_9ASTR|nr:hypothetical protein E3N88_42787 [Mikania micrantha]